MEKENFCHHTFSLGRYEKEQIRSLWASTFGDDDVYIDRALHSFLRDALCFYTVCEKEIVSVFFTIPTELGYPDRTYSAFYLYCAMTKESLRGKHLFTNLFGYAKSLLKDNFGADFILLVPAKESLFDFYRTFSFEETSFYREEKVTAGLDDYSFSLSDSIPDVLYDVYRENCLSFPHCLIKERELFEYSLRDKMSDGYNLVLFDGGFALEKDGRIYHICTKMCDDSLSVCRALCSFLDKEEVSARLFSESGKPFCMALSLCGVAVENICCSLLFE